MKRFGKWLLDGADEYWENLRFSPADTIFKTVLVLILVFAVSWATVLGPWWNNNYGPAESPVRPSTPRDQNWRGDNYEPPEYCQSRYVGC